MAFFKISLQRSAIGLPKKTHLILQTLGLTRRTRTVYHPAEPQFAGMIMKVKELVSVKEVETAETTREMRDSRKPDPGYYIEKLGPTSEAYVKTVQLEMRQKQSREKQIQEAKKAASIGDANAQAEYLRLLMSGEKDVKATMER